MVQQKKKIEKKPEKKTVKKPGKGLTARLAGLDDDRKRILKKVSGLVVGAFAVFTFIALLSYLFTWKTDQSLLSDPDMMDKTVEVSNMAGKLGYRWALFLCSGCFGLGSFAIVYLLGAYAVRLVLDRKDIGFMKTLLVSVSGAFVFSLILAFVSDMAGVRSAFGGGLGGDCGEVLVDGLENLTGSIVSFIIILLFLVLWLLLVSGRFSAWLSGIGEGKRSGKQYDSIETSAADERTDFNAPVPDDDGYPVSGDGGEPGYDDAAGGPFPDDSDDPSPEAPLHETSVPAGLSPSEPEPVRATASSVRPAGPEDTGQEQPGLEVVKGDGYSAKVTRDLPRIDVREELEKFVFPPLDLLDDYASGRHEVASEELERNNNKIRATLLSYKIQVERVTACVGPTVTLYKVVPAPGVKISAIKNLEQDIAMSLNAKGVRVVRLSDSVGIEVANDRASIVPLKSMLNDDAFRKSKAELPVAIGYTITQKVKVFDLADAPHLLVAGATKQGKSVGLNVIVTSLLYAKHPSELKFVMIDPKMVEFSMYAPLEYHYIAQMEGEEDAIITNMNKAVATLNSLVQEMEDRLLLLNDAHERNIEDYNKKFVARRLNPEKGHKFLPYIVVVIDELADLIMNIGRKEVEMPIARITQKARAVGIHMILATQRPSTDIITGVIKANCPGRIAFRVTQMVDSRTILDRSGAQQLIGRGDMLITYDNQLTRVQCAFVDTPEVEAIVDYISNQVGFDHPYELPKFVPEQTEGGSGNGGGFGSFTDRDPLFDEAAEFVVSSGNTASTSSLQRRYSIGYNRAGKLMDQMEAAGIVGPAVGGKPRQVLVDAYGLESILNQNK